MKRFLVVSPHKLAEHILLNSQYNLLASHLAVFQLIFGQGNWGWWAASTKILSVSGASSLYLLLIIMIFIPWKNITSSRFTIWKAKNTSANLSIVKTGGIIFRYWYYQIDIIKEDKRAIFFSEYFLKLFWKINLTISILRLFTAYDLFWFLCILPPVLSERRDSAGACFAFHNGGINFDDVMFFFTVTNIMKLKILHPRAAARHLNW